MSELIIQFPNPEDGGYFCTGNPKYETPESTEPTIPSDCGRQDYHDGHDVESEGEPEFLSLNAKYEVCDTCNGRGKTVNPSIDGNGISSDQFDEDPEFARSYFRGDYDVTCRTCEGKRVVLVVDEENNPADLLKKYEEYEHDRYADARERYNEMRMEGQEVFMSDFGY